MQRIEVTVLHHFTGGKDGCCVYAGLAKDRRGNFYGITYLRDHNHRDGVLFKLRNTNQGYRFQILHSYSPADGRFCVATPTPDKSGNILGVCEAGGENGDGTLWEYSSSGQFTVLHSFARDIDGTYPQDSVAIDQSGGIYGTTTYGGTGEGGTLWKYWRESGNLIVLHSFALGDDGGDLPAGPRIEKRTGVVWGTTKYGPNCNYCGPGTVWNYDPPSGTFTTIADFDSQVYAPLSRLILDNEGNAYGTSGNGCCGGVYELPKNDNYIPVAIYEFKDDADGASPYGRVRFDEHGNLLGTTTFGGDFGVGTVYKLTNKNGTWHKTILHSFAPWEAYQSVSGLKTDHKGNWFGTAAFGGIHDSGTVFEISGVH